MTTITNPNISHAKKFSRALEAKGITSDTPEEAPNPFWAAQEAFYICQGHRNAREWRELKVWLTGPAFPRWEYYRKLSKYCHRALRRHDFPEDLREAVTYAWGDLNRLAESLRRAEAGLSM